MVVLYVAMRDVSARMLAFIAGGRRYGGDLSDLGVRRRDGSTHCPFCDSDGFVPTRVDDYVRCMTCRTVFRGRKPTRVLDVLGEGLREIVSPAPGRRHRQ